MTNSNFQKREIVRYVILGTLFSVIFIPMALLPMFEKGPERIPCPNPDPGAWIAAAQKLNSVDIDKMNIRQLQIASTAMQAETSHNVKADLHDIFRNMRGIGWTAVALFAALAFQNIIFIRREPSSNDMMNTALKTIIQEFIKTSRENSDKIVSAIEKQSNIPEE